MKYSYKKGSLLERQLFKKFWDNGWAAMRAAGSGNKKVPDIIAGNGKKLVVIECKVINNDHIYLKKNDIEKLVLFGLRIKAQPFLCIKFKNNSAAFYMIDDLNYTKNNCYKISSQQKGISFEDLIS